MNTQITYRGIELDIEYDPYPAENGGRESPSWDAYIEITGVTLVNPQDDLREILDNSGFRWDEIETLVEMWHKEV